MFDLNVIAVGLGILTLVLTVLLFRKRRNPGRITVVPIRAIPLLSEVGKQFDELSIHFAGSEISHNLVFYAGLIVNDGEKDISPEMVHTPLTASVEGDGVYWRSWTVNAEEDDGFSDLPRGKIDGRHARIDPLGLLRRDEVILFFLGSLSLQTQYRHREVVCLML